MSRATLVSYQSCWLINAMTRLPPSPFLFWLVAFPFRSVRPGLPRRLLQFQASHSHCGSHMQKRGSFSSASSFFERRKKTCLQFSWALVTRISYISCAFSEGSWKISTWHFQLCICVHMYVCVHACVWGVLCQQERNEMGKVFRQATKKRFFSSAYLPTMNIHTAMMIGR